MSTEALSEVQYPHVCSPQMFFNIGEEGKMTKGFRFFLVRTEALMIVLHVNVVPL